MTQAFCDQQLRECMEAEASLPECQTAIDAAGLAVDWPKFSRGRYAAAEAQARRAGLGVHAPSPDEALPAG